MKRLLMTACFLLAPAMLVAQSHTIVVLSHNDHTVYELDPATGKILHQFKASDQPHEAAVTADGKLVYASIPLNTPLVEILDGPTFREKGRIESEFFTKSPRPGAPRATPGTQAAALETTTLPHGLALTNDASKLYIGVEYSDVPGLVVYDARAGKVLKKIDLLLKGGHYFQIQPATDKLYYPHRDDNRVVVVDTKTDRILKIIPVPGGPVGVAFAPNGEVWIHGDGDKEAGDGIVAVIDSKNDSLSKTISTGGKGAGRMAVSADGKWAASTHSGSQDVAIIDTAKREVAATVKVGKGPGFPLFSPDNAKLYVMNSGENDVAIIDLKTMTVTARHKVGSGPFGGGIRFPGGL